MRTLEDVHSRPVHTLVLNEGSKYADSPAESHEVFLTLACDDTVKLWDLRVQKCVRRFEGAGHSIHACATEEFLDYVGGAIAEVS